MILERTNIETRLKNLRSRELQGASLSSLLETLQIIAPGSQDGPQTDFDLNRLDAERIYHISQIRQICIDYRLRFLDLKYFKPELPGEAKTAIAELEATHKTQVEGMKILAPSRLFKLEDKDDPLLMAPLGNGYYYLVHKWGNDLHPLRKWLVWPFRNVVNLAMVVLVLSYLLTLMIPEGLFSKQNTTGEFLMLFFFMFKSLAAIVIFYGFALGKNFNPAIWNSKYYNA